MPAAELAHFQPHPSLLRWRQRMAYDREPNLLPLARLSNLLNVHCGDHLIPGVLQTLFANVGTLRGERNHQNCARFFRSVSPSRRVLADLGVCFEPSLRGFIDRYEYRHPDRGDFHRAERTSPLSWLDDLLYLPEVLYVLFFIWLICSGPGGFSVDYWIAGQLLR